VLRTRQKIGKYRIQNRIGKGGFAEVYCAFDTVEGIPVALKIPHAHLVTKDMLNNFRNEVKLTAQLDHPNILPIKNAGFVEEHFVIVSPLGERTLDDRLRQRMSLKTALCFVEQTLEALAYAHGKKIIHCDVKPDNLLLFPENRLRLADFGIARIAQRTIKASGSGTVGYIAPEQAMGRPSPRSDVFSTGLLIYRMLSGTLPEWPYSWPPVGYERVKKSLHPDLIGLIKRAMEVDQHKRYDDAIQMLSAFKRMRSRVLAHASVKRRLRANGKDTIRRDWKTVRLKQFQRDFGRDLGTTTECERCQLPVSEPMQACPWCGLSRDVHRSATRFPVSCPRCQRGLKLDWRFCPWCYGPSVGPATSREYSDVHYTGRCRNSACKRRLLMPFMRYCPWCRRRVQNGWDLAGTEERCGKCGWGVAHDYWKHCPWCTSDL